MALISVIVVAKILSVDDAPPLPRWGTGASYRLPDDFFAWPVKERRELVYRLAGRRKGQPGLMDEIRQTFSGGDPSFIPTLTAVVERDADVGVLRAALRGLTRCEDPAAIPGLMRGLASDDFACCWHSIHGLQARLGARDAAPGLIELLGRRRLRTKAAEALVTIRDERALQPLRVASKHGWPRSRRLLREHAETLAKALGY